MSLGALQIWLSFGMRMVGLRMPLAKGAEEEATIIKDEFI